MSNHFIASVFLAVTSDRKYTWELQVCVWDWSVLKRYVSTIGRSVRSGAMMSRVVEARTGSAMTNLVVL